MNIKIKKIWLVPIIMFLLLFATITVNAEETDTYALEIRDTLESTTYDVIPYEQLKYHNVWTTEFYTPTTFYNVWICKAGGMYDSKYYVIFYDANTTISVSKSSVVFSSAFYYVDFKTLDEAYEFVFTEKEHADTKALAKGNYTAFESSRTYAYFIYPDSIQETAVGCYMDEAMHLESRYYDWYLNKNGEAPTLEEETTEDEETDKDYSGFWGWFQRIWDILSDGFIAVVDKLGDVTTTIENWLIDIVNYIKDIPQLLRDLKNLLDINSKLGTGTAYTETIVNAINTSLADNKFYTSVLSIRDTLRDLYNEDYTSRTGFYELGLTNLTIRQTTDMKYKDFGNEVIGKWEQGYEMENETLVKDWGIQDAKVLNLDWYFGKDLGDGYYTKGLKPTFDAFISAFLWLMFAWGLYVNLPNIISGEITQIGNLITNTHDTNTDFNTKDEQVFSMMTIDNTTGEILSDTTTYKKKGKGF